MDYPHCFIFDMDGTLVLSEHILLETLQTICRKRGMRTVTTKEYERLRGSSTVNVVRSLLNARHLPASDDIVQEIIDERRKLYDARLHLVERHEPIVSLLQALSPHYKIGLATSAPRKQGLAVLRHLEIVDLFDCMVFGDEVKHQKPDPECYQTVAKQLGVRPTECVVFEDSDSGIAAARAFGAQVVKVTV